MLSTGIPALALLNAAEHSVTIGWVRRTGAGQRQVANPEHVGGPSRPSIFPVGELESPR